MLTRLEQETIMNYNQAEDMGNVFTYDSKVIKRLTECCEERPDECQEVRVNSDGGHEYNVPKSWITCRPPKKMNISDEKRAELAEKMRNIRHTRANG